MKTWAALLLLAASGSLVPPAFAEDAVIARVNGIEIKESDLDFAATEVGPRLGNYRAEDRRRVLLQFLIENELMATAAEEKNLDESDTFDARVAYHTRRALRDAFFDARIVSEVKESDAKKVYDEQIPKMQPQKDVKARHILVATEEEAKAVKAELEKGGDFAKLANEKSQDKNAKDGELGFFSRGQMLKPFEEAAYALEVGEFSDPVKTVYGWHIIEVQETRDQKLPAFDEVKEAIMRRLVDQQAFEVITGLRNDSKIEIVDPDIKRAMDDAVMRGEAPPLPEEEFKDEN